MVRSAETASLVARLDLVDHIGPMPGCLTNGPFDGVDRRSGSIADSRKHSELGRSMAEKPLRNSRKATRRSFCQAALFMGSIVERALRATAVSAVLRNGYLAHQQHG